MPPFDHHAVVVGQAAVDYEGIGTDDFAGDRPPRAVGQDDARAGRRRGHRSERQRQYVGEGAEADVEAGAHALTQAGVLGGSAGIKGDLNWEADDSGEAAAAFEFVAVAADSADPHDLAAAADLSDRDRGRDDLAWSEPFDHRLVDRHIEAEIARWIDLDQAVAVPDLVAGIFRPAPTAIDAQQSGDRGADDVGWLDLGFFEIGAQVLDLGFQSWPGRAVGFGQALFAIGELGLDDLGKARAAQRKLSA